MSTVALLERLEAVKRTGADRWVALCPAHEDRRPSLGVRELGDGRTLVVCRAGCETYSVLAAIGLTFDVLFPPERAVDHHVARERRPFDAWTTLRSLPTELAIVVIYVSDVRADRKPSEADHERFLLAVERITRAATLAGA
jgi:hypothetical protein